MPPNDPAKAHYVSAADVAAGVKKLGGTRNGANVTGKSIDGGTRQKLAKGDFLIVPAGVPHQFTDISPAGISLMQLYLPKTN